MMPLAEFSLLTLTSQYADYIQRVLVVLHTAPGSLRCGQTPENHVLFLKVGKRRCKTLEAIEVVKTALDDLVDNSSSTRQM